MAFSPAHDAETMKEGSAHALVAIIDTQALRKKTEGILAGGSGRHYLRAVAVAIAALLGVGLDELLMSHTQFM